MVPFSKKKAHDPFTISKSKLLTFFEFKKLNSDFAIKPIYILVFSFRNLLCVARIRGSRVFKKEHMPWFVWLGCVSPRAPKGCWFDSQSVHMPGFQAQSVLGCMQGAANLMFYSHINVFPSLPLHSSVSF